MVGYPLENENYAESNLVNNLFQLDCTDEFELSLRHTLVNLMAMILLGGQQSFLWTFAFQPLTLANTFGFGSTSPETIQADRVHYDCGCIITENGNLVRYPENDNKSLLDVPAVYVAYFSTYGALAWHLLLFDKSVSNLYGPILAPVAIVDTNPGYRLEGANLRAKVCHFVRTRLLSTFHLLSNRSSQSDTCILLNRCFEQMAFLTQNGSSWIKSTYTILDDQLEAEGEFQNKVFCFVDNKLNEYKTYMNHFLQTEIQKDLQNFIDQMPIIIQFAHFKTALYRSINSQSSLKILRHILNCFDSLGKTRLIYDLSQFYLLLHQTYTQLIELNEFLTITLKELYDQGEKHYNHSHSQQYQNENKSHHAIIENGIAAVNNYHELADGMIRPGACNETQRFSKITFDTPVSYLVTNENHDEGDIIMRILSVLVDYHNHSLDLLEKELNNNQNDTNGVLKNLVNELTSKEVSIIKIASDHTGVLTLDEKDCLWIERLSQASLISDKERYCLTSDSPLTFDFSYVQSQIIRTYLLLCRIDYRHIIQKYQCHTKKIQTTTTTNVESLDLDEKYLIPLSDDQRENEWMYLKGMFLDKLYQAHSLLRQIALTLKNHPDDKSLISLFNFVRMTDHDNDLYQKLEQYEIKDFQLCHIDHVLTLYTEAMTGFQYLFTDIPSLLRISIDSPLNEELIQLLNDHIINIDYKNDVNKIHSSIQMITELLNELKTIEDTLLQQSIQPLAETCEHVAIENPILLWIPKGIKCENYVAFNIHLIRTRASLQERKVNLEEKEKKLWDENLHSHEQQDKQGNRFHQYLNPQDEEQTFERKENSDHSDNWTLPFMDMEGLTTEDEQQIRSEDSPSIELNIKLVPCMSSVFIQEIHKYREEPQAESILVTKAQKFTIINPDGKSVSYLCKIEKLLEQLKKLVNPDVLAVVDKNEIFFDFINYRPSYPLFLEYRIIEKQLLIQVQFRFQTQVFEYLTTSKCNISTIIHRFIDDNKLKSLSADLILGFFDEYGKCIDHGIIDDLCKTSNKTVVILVTEEVADTNTLCEITLQYKEDHHETNLFHLTAQWQQIDLWLKTLLQDIDFPVDNYAFLTRQQKTIVENNDTISSVLNQSESVTIDIIDRNTITKVIFTYETHSQFVYALTSIKIASLLNDENLLRQLNLNDLSSDDYVLVLGGTNERLLTKEDRQQSVGTYLTTGDQSIHFRISILVQITKYDDQKHIQIPLSTRDTTIEQLLQLTRKSVDVYKYLALNDTKRIIDYQEIISNLNTTELILVKESETCLVSIKRSDNGDERNEKDERYAVFASMADISQENQYLLYADDFVPSKETQLTSFQSAIPIRFTIIDDNLPVTVTVENKETDETITFNCSLSMTVKRIYAVSCQLFGLSNEFYQLMQDGSTLIDDDMPLEEIDETMTNIQFQVTSTMSTHCSVKFAEQTITLPCNEDTPASTIVKETIKKLHIPYDDIEQYELIPLNGEQTKIDFDTIIEDMRQLFSSTTTMLSFEFELRKKDG